MRGAGPGFARGGGRLPARTAPTEEAEAAARLTSVVQPVGHRGEDPVGALPGDVLVGDRVVDPRRRDLEDRLLDGVVRDALLLGQLLERRPVAERLDERRALDAERLGGRVGSLRDSEADAGPPAGTARSAVAQDPATREQRLGVLDTGQPLLELGGPVLVDVAG